MQLNGKELSFNNINDTNGALELLKEFEEPTVVACKHGNPCGVGSADNIVDAWRKAYQSDPTSVFGGIVTINREVTEELAKEMIPVFLEVVVYRWGFSNRGALFGPYCIIYGVGALILIFSLSGLKKQRITVGKLNITPLLVFLGIVVITTVVELIGSYIMEWTQGGWMWDYSEYFCNFQGRIALNPSVRFGIGGMIILYLLQPLFERLTGRLSKKALCLTGGAIALLLLVDFLHMILT